MKSTDLIRAIYYEIAHELADAQEIAQCALNEEIEWEHSDHPVDWLVDRLQHRIETELGREFTDMEHEHLFEIVDAGMN